MIHGADFDAFKPFPGNVEGCLSFSLFFDHLRLQPENIMGGHSPRPKPYSDAMGRDRGSGIEETEVKLLGKVFVSSVEDTDVHERMNARAPLVAEQKD